MNATVVDTEAETTTIEEAIDAEKTLILTLREEEKDIMVTLITTETTNIVAAEMTDIIVSVLVQDPKREETSKR